jgi:tetratricopeptide (TPR) repeat protein
MHFFAQTPEDKTLTELDSMAFAALEKGKPTQAGNLALQVIEKEKNNSLYLVNAYTLLGIVNKNRGYYISSVENYLKALEIAEKLKDQGRVSACLNNIGVIYQLQHNYKLAISYFNKSLQIEEKGTNALQRSIRYYNLAECFLEVDSLDLALSYYNNSLIIEEKYKNNEGALYAYLGISEVYLKLENSYQAKMMLDKVVNRIKNVNPEVEILYHKLQGNYHLVTNNPTAALPELALSWDISNKVENTSFLLEILLLQISSYEKLGEIDQANKLYKKYISLQEDFNNSEIKNKIEDLTYQNELTKKELEIKLVQEERNLALKNAETQASLRKFEQRIMWFVMLVLVTTLVMIVYGFKKVANFKR